MKELIFTPNPVREITAMMICAQAEMEAMTAACRAPSSTAFFN